jgi:hypothetical protein
MGFRHWPTKIATDKCRARTWAVRIYATAFANVAMTAPLVEWLTDLVDAQELATECTTCTCAIPEDASVIGF